MLVKVPVPVHSHDVIIELTIPLDAGKKTTPHSPTEFGEKLDTKLNRAGCGVAAPMGRIADGQPVKKRQQIPWIVNLGVHVAGLVYGCGGSIITSNVVLTAAHCVVKVHGDAPTEKVVVYYNTTSDREGVSTQVERAAVHPKYDPPTLYDMALLKLEDPLKFDAFVKPICLPTHKIPVQGKPLLSAGWGLTGITEDKTSKKLLYAELRALPDEECLRTASALLLDGERVIAGPSICTRESKSTCRGDSGGPLSLRDGDGKALLVGVTSAGDNCTEQEIITGIFARVSSYMPWIKKALSHPREWKPFSTGGTISLV